MNCPDFELLSAYADGETTPEECIQVESHRKSCDACQALLANLSHLARGIQQPQPLPLTIRVQPPRKDGWWQRLRALSDSPVVHLVSLQRRRRARFGTPEMLKMMALFALPVFFMWLSPDRSPLTAFMLVSALGLMVGLPLRQFSEEVALLASLRRGRCLEEIVGTGTSAQGLLDGLAVQGLMQILRAAVTVWPVLLVGTLGLPFEWQPAAWGVELLWLPGLVGLFLVGYYLAQFLQMRSSNWLRTLLVAFPWTLALLGLPGCLLAGLLSGVMARRFAIEALENPERIKAVPVHRRNPLVRSWSQNPIARREMSRLAAGMGGNWKRLVLWRASMFLLPVAWAAWALLAGLAQWPDVFASGVLLFSGLFFVRSAARTLPSVVRERELQSWEILMQTPLGTRTFVSGWLQVCLYTVFTEGALALLMLGGYVCSAVSIGHQAQPLACLLVLPAASLLGAYVGLALSAASRTHRQASQSLLLWCLGGGLGWLLLWGLGQGVMSTVWETPGGFDDPLAIQPVLGELSLLALLPVGLLLALRARVLLKKLPYSDPQEGQTESTCRYSPVVTCLDLASLLFLLYGLITWEAWQRETDVSAMKGALLLLVSMLGWIFAIRFPLATLAEWGLGQRLSLLLGTLFGLLLSWAANLAALAVSFKLGEPWLRSLECSYATLFACLVAGVGCGGLAATRRPGAWPRHETLRKRLLWSLVWVLALPFARLSAVPEAPRKAGYNPKLVGSLYTHQLLALQELGMRGEIVSGAKDYEYQSRRRKKTIPLRGNLPPFGKAADVVDWSELSKVRISSWFTRRLLGPLKEQAECYVQEGNYREAFNCCRWALLLQDAAPARQIDSAYNRESEWEEGELLDVLQKATTGFQLSRTQVRELAQQLQAYEWEQDRLVASYENCNYQSLYRGNHPNQLLDALLPQFYLKREREARQLGLARGAQLSSQFALWELSRQAGMDLIHDVPLAPLARQRVGDLGVDLGLAALARQWSRREGLALLLGLQLYRQEHQGNWPATLEEANQYLPRPARCYLNHDGHFDYEPGRLSCAKDNNEERIWIYETRFEGDHYSGSTITP